MPPFRSGIFDLFCGVLKLLRLQFFPTDRLFHKDPPPHRTFVVFLVKKVHFSNCRELQEAFFRKSLLICPPRFSHFVPQKPQRTQKEHHNEEVPPFRSPPGDQQTHAASQNETTPLLSEKKPARFAQKKRRFFVKKKNAFFVQKIRNFFGQKSTYFLTPPRIRKFRIRGGNSGFGPRRN